MPLTSVAPVVNETGAPRSYEPEAPGGVSEAEIAGPAVSRRTDCVITATFPARSTTLTVTV